MSEPSQNNNSKNEKYTQDSDNVQENIDDFLKETHYEYYILPTKITLFFTFIFLATISVTTYFLFSTPTHKEENTLKSTFKNSYRTSYNEVSLQLKSWNERQ